MTAGVDPLFGYTKIAVAHILRELLARMPDDPPLARDDLRRLGYILAELGQSRLIGMIWAITIQSNKWRNAISRASVSRLGAENGLCVWISPRKKRGTYSASRRSFVWRQGRDIFALRLEAESP